MIIKKSCNFESDYKDGQLLVVLNGEIDHHSAVSVRSSIDAKIYEYRPRSMVMDLSKIEFMDSSGLGLIMGRYALMQRIGGELTLRNPNERVMKIFELAGLERIIKVEEDKEKENEKTVK